LEAERTFKTSVNLYKTTRLSIQEDSHLQFRRDENLKFHVRRHFTRGNRVKKQRLFGLQNHSVLWLFHREIFLAMAVIINSKHRNGTLPVCLLDYNESNKEEFGLKA
jgi:hypothetical protein